MISKGQVIVVVDTYDVVSHIQRIGCQAEQLLYPVANPARGLLIREKKEIEKHWQRTPPLPPPRAARSEKTNRKSRHASTCLGATQVSVRLASAQGFLRLVGWANWHRFARFTLPFAMTTLPVSLPLSSSGDVSPRVYLLFPPRGHEPPPTHRDRFNSHLSL